MDPITSPCEATSHCSMEQSSLDFIENPAQQNGTSRSACLLLDLLPVELRLEIYRYSLLGLDFNYPCFAARYGKSHMYRPRICTPSLVRTCRQVRFEVLSMWYGGTNTIRVDVDPKIEFDTMYLERFVEDLGEDVRFVRRLEISHTVDSSMLRHTPNWIADFGTKCRSVTQFITTGGREIKPDVEATTTIHTKFPSYVDECLMCTCQVSTRLSETMPQVSNFTVSTSLTLAISSFLRLMDAESTSQPLVSKRPGYHRQLRSAEDSTLLGQVDHPPCSTCGKCTWFLQGPSSSIKRKMDGLRDDEVVYKGFKWRWCPYELIN